MAWRAIRNLPPQIQHRHLRHEILCGSPAMFELLSTKSRVEGRRDRQRGVELAELALSSVEGSARVLGKTFQDLHDLALARLGNALRLAGDYAGADRAFQRAEASRESPQAKRDPRVEADFCFLKGSLRLFQRRYDESLSLLAKEW
ncbi:MAG: hypothetical protein GY835_24920 [bacterium]|nr:hypothetical protein [bacterium]